MMLMMTLCTCDWELLVLLRVLVVCELVSCKPTRKCVLDQHRKHLATLDPGNRRRSSRCDSKTGVTPTDVGV